MSRFEEKDSSVAENEIFCVTSVLGSWPCLCLMTHVSNVLCRQSVDASATGNRMFFFKKTC